MRQPATKERFTAGGHSHFSVLIFSDCFLVVLLLASLSVTTASMRRHLDPTEVAEVVKPLQDGTSICATGRMFAQNQNTKARHYDCGFS